KYLIPGTNSFWREVQTWGKYAYVTTEGCCNGLQIVNLSNLPGTPTSKYWTGSGAIAGQVGKIHTVHIRDGYAYLNGSTLFGGASLICSLADPWNPVYLGNTQLAFSGNLRYVHDCFVRNDTLWAAHIYGGFFSAINISNKSAPALIATQTTPGSFTHNTWMSDQGSRVLYTTDEVSNSVLAAYDVSNTGNITQLDRLQGIQGSGSILHNTYVRNGFAINSYYKDGITIVDVSRPDNLITVGRFDTYPQGSGNGFNGAWGVYPYLPSGNILVSDIDNGLFVLTPTYVRAAWLEGTVRDSCSNALLSSVNVRILSGTHHDEQSKLTGVYKSGTATAGTFTVQFSKSGYDTLNIPGVTLQNGVLTTLNVRMRPSAAVKLGTALVQQPSCTGQSNGSIDIQLLNNPSGLVYSWSTGATSQDLLSIPAGTYTLTVSDGLGCTATQQHTLIQPANPCSVLVSVRVFIEGRYSGNQSMNSLSGGMVTDTLILQLRQPASPYGVLLSAQATVDTSGWAHFIFPPSIWQQSAYAVIRHRNSLETWSKTPLSFPAGTKQFQLGVLGGVLRSVPDLIDAQE
ncbi:MAG: choice-of-anchor B family protein, partial [Bacteroidota bacterium]